MSLRKLPSAPPLGTPVIPSRADGNNEASQIFNLGNLRRHRHYWDVRVFCAVVAAAPLVIGLDEFLRQSILSPPDLDAAISGGAQNALHGTINQLQVEDCICVAIFGANLPTLKLSRELAALHLSGSCHRHLPT